MFYKLKKFSLVFLLFLINHSSFSSNLDTTKTMLKSDFDTIIQLNSIEKLFIKHDSMLNKNISKIYKASDTIILNSFFYSPDSIPDFSDSIYAYRIQNLNLETPIYLHYNRSVQEQIDLYALKYRQHVSKMLGKARYYFPIFEEILERFDLPLELKYLAVVESALKPQARSRSAATGLWQFMYNTGKIYDLNVNSYIDERSDPIKSTIAACEYFVFLHKMFNDWELVLAAYNGGPGYISRAMRKTGKKDYWSIRPFLRQETQNYIPKFIAINYIMQYAPEHNISPTPFTLNLATTDTVSIIQTIKFKVLSNILDIPMKTLNQLNPIYKKELVPVAMGEKKILRMPREKISLFLSNMDTIYKISMLDQKPFIEQDESVIHVVKSGEYLGKIASKYNTTINKLMIWNNLSKTNLKIGQKLVVYKLDIPKKSLKKSSNYIVKPGDTLWGIAQLFQGISVVDIKKLNNITSNTLKPGTTIKIPKI